MREKGNTTSAKKEELDKIYSQTLEDFNILDSKANNLIILIGGVAALFIQIVNPSTNPYGFFLYLFIIGLFLGALGILVYSSHPKKYSALNHNNILSYQGESEQFLSITNNQKTKSISKILMNIESKSNLTKIALWLFFTGTFLSLGYKIIYFLGGN